jgi:hypothetical protein
MRACAACLLRYEEIYSIFTGTLAGLFGAAVVLVAALLISMGAYVPVGCIYNRVGRLYAYIESKVFKH